MNWFRKNRARLFTDGALAACLIVAAYYFSQYPADLAVFL